MRRPLAVVVWLALPVLLAGAGCAAPRPEHVSAAPARPVPADLLPGQFAGLTATPEDITRQEKEAGAASYLTSTRLWALRSGTRLRATLQVGRLASDAFASGEEDDVLAFEEQVVAQIGQAAPRQRVLGGRRVYVTSGSDQPLYVWFTGSALFVLSMAKDFEEPRALLRRALELTP